MNKQWLFGCLTWLILITICVGIGTLISECTDDRKDYLVVESNYFHSTDNSDECKFIKLANEKKYTIKKIYRTDAVKNNSKMCKICFSLEEQNSYDSFMKRKKEHDSYDNDERFWFAPFRGKDICFDSLYVYMDKNDILHLNGGCDNISGNKQRKLFVEVTKIHSTCVRCVGREYCDFIYKAIYEGDYDTNLIKDVDETDTE